MKNALITGGTGFVGYWLKQSMPAGVYGTFLSRADYLMWNWRDIKWDYIIHLAPVPPYAVVAQAERYNARLLYCSSGIVYHPEAGTEYRRNKLNGEKYCLDSGIDVVIARLFTFYGEHLDADKAYSRFTKAAKANKPIEIWGDGSCVRSYMHGADMAEWMWAILLRGKCGEAYDVGSDEPITMLQLAKFIRSQARSRSEIVIQGGTELMPHYLPPDTAKTRSLVEKVLYEY